LYAPLDGVLGVDLVASTNAGVGLSASGDTLTRAGHADVKVHTVNTDRWVVLDTQVNVLVDTETEVAGLGEVALAELVLLDLEATLENLLGLWSADGDVDGDLFVTTDTEGTDGVAGLACGKSYQPSAMLLQVRLSPLVILYCLLFLLHSCIAGDNVL